MNILRLRVDGEYPYNINKMSLRKIYGSDLFTYVRNIDKRGSRENAGIANI